MTRLRFVHAADLHLDSPFTGLQTVVPDIAAHLREATFAAYDAIVDACISERVDALLIAGDIYDGADRSLRAQLKFVEGLQRIDAAGIRSFVCHGNHDPLDGWEARLTLPPGCHRFGPRAERVPFDPEDPDRALICGISYPKRDVRENLIGQFERCDPGIFAIGLVHCNVGGNTEHEAYAPCTLDDLKATGIDYWALGHIHTRQVLHEADPTVVYPGNPQGRHAKETGARGAYLVDVSDSRQIRLEFFPADTVRWECVEVSIDGLETEQHLLDIIQKRSGQAVNDADGRHLVYRIIVGGRGPLHHAVRRSGFADDLHDRVNDSYSGQTPFAWCERVDVSTTVPFDREDRRQASDFIGDLLRLIDQVRDDDDLLPQVAAKLEPLFHHGRAKRYLRQLPTIEELRSLLTEAETRCLRELVEA